MTIAQWNHLNKGDLVISKNGTIREVYHHAIHGVIQLKVSTNCKLNIASYNKYNRQKFEIYAKVVEGTKFLQKKIIALLLVNNI